LSCTKFVQLPILPPEFSNDTDHLTEHNSVLVITSALHSGDTQFESWPESQLHCLKYLQAHAEWKPSKTWQSLHSIFFSQIIHSICHHLFDNL